MSNELEEIWKEQMFAFVRYCCGNVKYYFHYYFYID
jgi:hypothetical protein